MTPDDYLRQILRREDAIAGNLSPVTLVLLQVQPAISAWAGSQLVSVTPSGSFAKGTANRSGTDIDLFVSLAWNTTEDLREIYESLFAAMQRQGYAPTRQNVSINITMNGLSVDLVPGRQQGLLTSDHSLFRRRANTWTKTNIETHINYVRRSGLSQEIRVMKLWRQQKRLDFPSFYLELTAIDALSSQRSASLSANVWAVFKYLRDRFAGARVLDPANTSNVISDDLTSMDRLQVCRAAGTALASSNWNEIVV
ncbi:MAG: nucleotidyltransferase domain-containing protein [Myxococcota bacterium]|nr:nucleotidyltransferase domain-containing protein [Myxococcota bacterium]